MPEKRLERTREAYVPECKDCGDTGLIRVSYFGDVQTEPCWVCQNEMWRRYVAPALRSMRRRQPLPANYGSEQPPDGRCVCGAMPGEPHAPECWRLHRDEPGYGMGVS
jgi:hypothetical protein